MSPSIELHGLAGCPFAWRTRLTAYEKGIAFDYVARDAEPPDPRASRNPNGRSPLLIHGDFQLTESVVIMQYLDEAFPGSSLQPEAPAERARMRLAMEEITPMVPGLRPGAPMTDETRRLLARGHDAFERWLGHDGGFVIGGSVTLADIQAWPFLARAWSLGVDASEGRPSLAAYWARVRGRPSFVQTRPAWAEALG